jgi:hypothetical protein
MNQASEVPLLIGKRAGHHHRWPALLREMKKVPGRQRRGPGTFPAEPASDRQPVP